MDWAPSDDITTSWWNHDIPHGHAWLDIAQSARRLGVQPRQLEMLRSDGLFPATIRPSQDRWTAKVIDAWAVDPWAAPPWSAFGRRSRGADAVCVAVHQVGIDEAGGTSGPGPPDCSIGVVVFDTAPGLVAMTVPLHCNEDTTVELEDLAAAVARVLAPAWWLHTRVLVPTSGFDTTCRLPPSWVELSLEPRHVPLLIAAGMHERLSRWHEWWPLGWSQLRTWGRWSVEARFRDHHGDRSANKVAAMLGRSAPFFPPGTSMDEIVLWASNGAHPVFGLGTPPMQRRSAVSAIQAAARDQVLAGRYAPVVRRVARALADDLEVGGPDAEPSASPCTDGIELGDGRDGWQWALVPDPQGAAHGLRCLVPEDGESVEISLWQEFLAAADSPEMPALWADLADLLAEFDSAALWPGGAVVPLPIPQHGAAADWLRTWRRATLPDHGSRRVRRLADKVDVHHWFVEELQDERGRYAVIDRRSRFKVGWVEWPVVTEPRAHAAPADAFIVGEHIRGGSALWLTRGTSRAITEAIPLVRGDVRFGLCPRPMTCCGHGLPYGAYRAVVALTTGTVLSDDQCDRLSEASELWNRMRDVPFNLQYGVAQHFALDDVATVTVEDGVR